MAVATFIGASAFFSVLLVTILPDDWPIHAGNLGLTLTYATSLIVWFQWGVQQSAEGENMVRYFLDICSSLQILTHLTNDQVVMLCRYILR